MIDLASAIFSVPELVLPALWNGVQLAHGAVLSRRFDKGRPGIAGEYPAVQREGSADHATIYVHAGEACFVAGGAPKAGDEVSIAEDLREYQRYTVRMSRGPKGGFYELMAMRAGTRGVLTDKGKAGGGRRLSG